MSKPKPQSLEAALVNEPDPVRKANWALKLVPEMKEQIDRWIDEWWAGKGRAKCPGKSDLARFIRKYTNTKVHQSAVILYMNGRAPDAKH